MLGPVIRTPLLDRMSIQLQFTLGNTGKVKLNDQWYFVCIIDKYLFILQAWVGTLYYVVVL